jgi:hypothetical protein
VGTGEDLSKMIYGRFAKPVAWSPPEGKRCGLAYFEGIPIASGFVGRADNPGTLQVKYEILSTFNCTPFISEREQRASMQDPRLRRLYNYSIRDLAPGAPELKPQN